MINFFGIPLSYSTVILIFLIITFLLGTNASRGVRTFRDYVLANKSFSTGMLALSYLATNFGGDIMADAGGVYTDGIIIFIAFLGVVPGYLFGAYFISNKITYFKDALTSGDVLKDLYGENAKILYGLLGTIHSCCLAGMGLICFSTLCKHFLNIDPQIGVIVAGIILTIYTVMGGIRSVTATDVFHFIFILFVIPFILFFLVNKFGGFKSIFLEIPKEKFIVFRHEKFMYYVSIFIVWCALPGIDISSPGLAQRILMGKTSSQIKNQLLIVSIIDPLFRVVVTLFGFIAIIKFKNIEPDDSILLIMKNYLDPKLQLAMILGFVALIMTSTDSDLHAGGVLFSYDFLKPLLKKFNVKNIDNLKLTKLVTFLIGIGSIIVGLRFDNLLDLGFFASGILYPVITMPLLFGVLGLKVSKNSFYIAFISTTITYLISSYLLKENDYLVPVISLAVNIITFLLSNLIHFRGFIILKRDNFQDDFSNEPCEKKFTINKNSFSSFFKNLIPTQSKILIFSKKEIFQSGSYHVLFGIYSCINFIFPYFLWNCSDQYQNDIITNLRILGGILSALLIIKDQWKPKFKPYYHLYWHFVILYCLPFLTTLMFISSNGSIPWLLSVGTSIFFMMILVSQKMFVTLYPLGFISALLFYKFFFGPISNINFDFDTNYHLTYQLLFPTIIGLLFSYRKRIFNLVRGSQGTNLGLAMSHEMRNTGLYIYPASQIANMYLKRYENKLEIYHDKRVYCVEENDFNSINQQCHEIQRLGKLQKKIIKTFESLFIEYRDSINNPKNYSMYLLVHECLDQYLFKDFEKNKIEVEYKYDFLAKVPKQVFIFVIHNILRNAFRHGNPSKIRIVVDKNKLIIRDNGKGIPENQIEKIFKMHFTTGNTSSSGIGLSFAKQIVEGFGGEIKVISQTGKNSYTEFEITFPKIEEELLQEELQQDIRDVIRKDIAKSMKDKKLDRNLIKDLTGIDEDDPTL